MRSFNMAHHRSNLLFDVTQPEDPIPRISSQETFVWTHLPVCHFTQLVVSTYDLYLSTNADRSTPIRRLC